MTSISLSLYISRLFSPTGSSIAHLSICFFLSLSLSLYITLLPSPPPHSPPFNYYPPFSSLLKNKTSLSLFHPPPLFYIYVTTIEYITKPQIQRLYISWHICTYNNDSNPECSSFLPPPFPGGVMVIHTNFNISHIYIYISAPETKKTVDKWMTDDGQRTSMGGVRGQAPIKKRD